MPINDFEVTFDINGDESGLRSSLDKAKRSVQDFSRDFNRAIANPLAFAPFVVSLRDAGREFSRLTASGTGAFRAIGTSAGNAAGNIIGLKRDIDGLKGSFVQFAATAVAAGVQAKIGIDFESAFADVRKVVEGSRDELKQLESDIKGLSTRVSIPLIGLTQIAAQGGQLGLPINELKDFIDLTAKVAVGFEQLPEEAGRSIGVLRAIFKLPIPELERLGDQINIVADKAKGIVNEGDIVDLLSRIGNSAQQFGLLRGETIALSGAILSLGKPPEVAATAIENLFTALRTADLQTEGFRNALRAMGIDAKKLANDIDKNPRKALDGFLETLESLSARSRTGAIQQLLGKGRDSQVLGELIQSLGEYRRLVELATNEEIFSGSLSRTFVEREKTVSAALQRLSNAFKVFSINATQLFLPTLRFAADQLRNLAVSMAGVAENFPNFSAFARITLLILPLAGAFRLLAVGVRLIAPAVGPAITALRGLIAAAAGGGVFAVLTASLRGVAGVLSAAFGGVFGRLILGIGLVTGAFSGLTAAASGFGATLFAIATNPFVLFIAGLTAVALRIAGAGSVILRFGAALGIAGRALLVMVGGPIGAAVAALTFLAVKFLEVKDRMVDFAGEQATVTEVIAAAWRAMTNPMADFATAVNQYLSEAAGDLLNFAGINQDTWTAVKTSLTAAGSSFGSFVKDVVNGLIRGFEAGRIIIGGIFDLIVSNIRTNLGSAVRIAQAAAKDFKAAFSGDFSAGNFAKAVADANKRNVDNIVNTKNAIKKNLADIGKTDYVGALVDGAQKGIKKAGNFFRNAVVEEIRKGRQVAGKALAEEQRKSGAGKAISFDEIATPTGGSKGKGRTVLDTARDDARQITQAQLQELRDSINQQQTLLQSQRDLDLQKAGENAQAKLAIERKYNDESLALKIQLLQAELQVKQQELDATGDRGDAALILADIKRLEGELSAARQLSGIEAQKLAQIEQQAADDRIKANDELRERLLQGTPIGEAEAFAAAQKQILDAFIDGTISSLEEFRQATEKVKQDFQGATEGMSVYADQAARNMQSAFADFLFDPFKDGLDGMLLNFVNILKRMAAEALSAQIFEAILGSQGKNGIRSGGLLSDLINSFNGQSGSGGGQPPAPQAPVAAAAGGSFGNFFSGIGDLFKSGLNSVLSGLSTAGGGITSFFSSFGDLIAQGFSALAGLFSGGGSGGSGFASGIAGLFSTLFSFFVRDGGYIEGFATGGSPGLTKSGMIRGPGTGTSDSIPANLPVGSFILRAAAVRKLGSDYLSNLGRSIEPAKAAANTIRAKISNSEWYFDPATVQSVGVGFLQHLNQFGAPPPMPQSNLAFAAGGLAADEPRRGSDAPSGNSGGNLRIINVVDPAMAKSWFESSSGEKVLMNHITRNARQINLRLGK